jgi:Ca2+-binding RTX toxin-like protein
MADNYGFTGDVPPGVSVSDNVARAKEYQKTHTSEETFNWFFDTVKNNSDGHLSQDLSMDYKQIDSRYENFGNFNYGAIGKALGYSDAMLLYGAGWAQGKADGLSGVEAMKRALLDPSYKGDNAQDQVMIATGILGAEIRGEKTDLSETAKALLKFIEAEASGSAAGWYKKYLEAKVNSSKQALADLRQAIKDEVESWANPEAENPRDMDDIDGDGILNEIDGDLDGDGFNDDVDDDIDGDGILNEKDERPSDPRTLSDIDGDGIKNEEDNDMDGDGTINGKDDDVDGDGILNEDDERSYDPRTEDDIDGDGDPNWSDKDIDGDGLLNENDPDALDPDNPDPNSPSPSPDAPIGPPPPPLQQPPPPPRGGDPLVLDLGGDGIITTGLDAGIHFDHDGDGFKELSGFVNPDDGLLVLDRNEDGSINDGNELFGDSTKLIDGSIAEHGFAALTEFDDQKDGKIDKTDAIFEKLRIFQDFNQNGEADEGELFSLDEKKIASLNLTYEDSSFVDEFGNIHRQLGTYVTESGEERTMTDVVFALDRSFTTTEMLDVPPDIAVLPDAVGYGTTYTLHQAMVRDGSGRLQELVEQYVDSSDRAIRQGLVEDILYVWTGQEEGSTPGFDKEIKVLDSFFGETLGGAWLRATNRFDQLKDMVTNQLSRQSHLNMLFKNISYTYNESADTWVGDYGEIVPILGNLLENATDNHHELVQELVQCVRGINPYNSLNLDALQSEVNTWIATPLINTMFNDETLGIMTSLSVGASDLDDVMNGGDRSGLLYGFSGDDTIFAEGGDDIIIGGKGDDALTGGAGNDIYRFSTGFGKDRINNFDTDAGRIDVIEFTEGIAQEDLVFSRHGDDLVINFANSTDDQLRIESHFYLDSTGGYAIDALRFADGSTLDIGSSGFVVLNEIVNEITEGDDILHGSLADDTVDGLAGNDQIFGKNGADTLTGSDGDDSLHGEGGNDILRGDAGNDNLRGGAGDDQLYGGDGADTLIGGSGANLLVGGLGDDYLQGGENTDTFRYGMGDGRDTISNRNKSGSTTDVLELTNGITIEDVSIRRVYNNLLLQISDGGEVWIENFFLNESPSLHAITFDDGTIWDQTTIIDMVRQGTAGNDFLYGSGTADILHGLEGNDRVEGYSGDDQLHGDEGSDKLYGGRGNDILLGGAGNDQLSGNQGNDTLTGGAGVDILTGGTGSDTYLYESGFGQDILYNNADATGTDAIVFGASITKEQVIAERRANNLVLRVDGTEDSITVSNYFLNIDAAASYAVDEIRFADGTNWDVAAIKQLTVNETAGDDVIHGYIENNVFDGLAGDDEIHGGGGNDHLTGNTGGDYLHGDAGNDTLIGNSGDDVLYGGDGDDILDGGEGDDIMSGYNGNDTFIFEAGFGNDKIIKNYYGNGESGTINFGPGITASQFSVRRSNRNLILTSTTSPDSLTIDNFFNQGETRAVGTPFNFVFADGSTLTFDSVIDQSLTSVTDGSDYLFGYEEDNTLTGDAGNDTLIGSGGVDTLSGGAGDDHLDGGTGNDTLTGGDGNDRIYGRDGDDVVTGGLGGDTVYAGSGNDSIQGEEGNDYLQGDAGNDTIAGGQGNDRLYAGSGDDTVTAGIGNDRLYGDTGNDILTGGEGDDYLTGGQGNDIYKYSVGFGKDTIDNYYNANNDAFDVIAFDETITLDSVKPVRKGNNLVLLVGEDGDQITVNNYFYSHAQGNYIVNEIQFADGTVWDIPTIKGLVLSTTEGADELHGYGTADSISGLGGTDTIFGHEGDDQLSGGAGDDVLDGGTGDDILVGGLGNDTLTGGTGNDVYRFSLGDGQDTINNNDSSGSVDVLELQEGITLDDVRLRRAGNHLIVFVGDDSDQVTVSNFFYNHAQGNYVVNEIQFADGTVWDIPTIKGLVLSATEGVDELHGYGTDDNISGLGGTDTIYGYEGDDQLSGDAGDDILDGGIGNDTLIGGSGNDTLRGSSGNDELSGDAGDDVLDGGTDNDTLLGGTGNDTLRGSSGDDILVGGLGNDTLSGGTGNDVYKFSLGDGQDTINNYDSSGSVDVLELQEGIALADVRLRRVGNDLVVLVGEDGDKVTVTNCFYNEGNSTYKLGMVRFFDGTTWSFEDIKTQAVTGSELDDTLAGFAVNDTMQGFAGNDTLNGAGGNDTLSGGTGNDTMHGGTGNDVLHGDAGDDTLYGTSGENSLYGDAGADTITGGTGNDIIVGGTGDDTLSGGVGDDVYQFSLGDGQDTITNYDSSSTRIDSIEFQPGIDEVDVRAVRTGSDLHLIVGMAGDQVTVNEYFTGEGHGSMRIDEVRFSGGTVWDIEKVKELVVLGSAGDDLLVGFADEDIMRGYGGNDTIQGQASNDIIYGGTGNDTLDGGTGNDIYKFALGDGHDVINNYDTSANRHDVIELQEGITTANVRAQRIENDLYLHVGVDDQIVVSGFFIGEGYGNYAVNEIQFADGTVWDIDKVKELVVLGTTGEDLLTGFAANDLMRGFAGNDTMDGFAGDDAIYGGAGDDALKGGAGNDKYYFSLGDGQDTIDNYDTSSTRHDAIVFDTTVADDAVLVKRNGNDLNLVVGVAGDLITVSDFFVNEGAGGYAIDEVRFSSGLSWNTDQLKKLAVLGTEDPELLLGYSSDDLMKGFGGNDTINGMGGDDSIYGGDGDDIIDAGSGSDTVYGESGADTIAGNDGDDTITAGAGDDNVDGGAGNDTIFGGIGADTLDGSFGNDVVEGGLGIDVINGGDGNDTLYGNEDNDQLFGGNHNDTIYGGTGEDAVEGNSGDDTVNGGDDDDTIHGNQGNDTLYGDSGNDNLYGDEGSDRLDGGIGEDQMSGGTGGDTYVVDNVGDEVIELADEGYDTIETDLDVTLGANVEKAVLTGTSNINATGNELANSLIGNAGDNILDGSTGGDTMVGGAGDDTYHTDILGETITEAVSGGTDTEIRSHESSYLLSDNVENLTLTGTIYRANGNELNNVLTGNDADNNLWGREGDDSLYGMGGDDQLMGDVGEDHLEGGAGNDLMTGGVGNDTLVGGLGDDQLDGGAGTNILRGGVGNDKYVYRSDGGIYEIDNSDGGDDWLLFTDDLTADRLAFIKSGDNLIVRVDGDENHQVTINNWFLGTEYQLYAIQPSGANGITAATINNMFPPSDAEADTITVPADSTFDGRRYGTSADEQLIGTSGNDIIRGYQGADNLFAQGGDDWLLGGSGNDYLDGGTGNDMLHAGAGDDRYVFKAGYGEDTIDNSGGGTDWLLLVDGLTQDKLVFSQVDDDLVITVTDSTDKITVKNWFLGSDYQVDYIQPDGGNGIPAAQIANLLTTDPSSAFDTVVDGTAGDEQLVGTAGTNQINGLDGVDQLFGLAGNDELNGGAGNDYLDGGAGDDVQNGDAGNDQLGGDAGNDTLVGGAGDDTYVYRPGSGADTIDNLGGGTDSLLFTDDITSDRLTYLKAEDNLIIRIDGDETTQVTVTDWFKGAEYQLSFIQPSGVSGIPASQINDLFATTPPSGGGGLEVPEESTFDAVRTGTTAGEQVVGTNGKDLLKGLEGDDQLFAFGGDDWLLGGDGNDYFDGGAGNDTMLGGAGNDQLGGDAGNDIMSAGAGDDKYVYRPGSGSDTIINSGGGTDWLLFTDDITSDRLSYWKSGDNLLVKIDGSNENMVTIQDWFLGGESEVTYIQPSGAYGISAAQINTMVQDEPAPAGEILTGTSADNQLSGGAGADKLSGLAGNDELTGGEGADEFVFDTALDSTNNIDTITDFSASEDKVILDNSVFNALLEEGVLSSVNFSSNTTGVAVDDNDYILYNTSTGSLLYDADGSGQGVAIEFATLSTKPQIGANNFSIVAS